MIEIHLDGNLYITSDSLNYIISKKKSTKDKDGNSSTVWEHINFFRTMEDALYSYYTENKLKVGEIKTFKQYRQNLVNAKKEIKKIIEEAFAL